MGTGNSFECNLECLLRSSFTESVSSITMEHWKESRKRVKSFKKRGIEPKGLYLVNVIVMVKIEKGHKSSFFVYLVDQDKRPSHVNPALVLQRFS